MKISFADQSQFLYGLIYLNQAFSNLFVQNTFFPALFQDYFVLIPQSFYEASQLQEKVTNPCEASGDPGP